MAEASKHNVTCVAQERPRPGVDSDRHGKGRPDTVAVSPPFRAAPRQFTPPSIAMAQLNSALDSDGEKIGRFPGTDSNPLYTRLDDTRLGEEVLYAVTMRRFLDTSRVFLTLLHTALTMRATRHRAGEACAVSSVGHCCSAQTLKQGEKYVVR